MTENKSGGLLSGLFDGMGSGDSLLFFFLLLIILFSGSMFDRRY